MGDEMLGIVKGDARYGILAKMLECSISSELCDFIGLDALLLPLGGIDDYYNIKQSNLNLIDILKENDIRSIIVGNANNKLKDLCFQKNIRLLELLKNQEYVRANARLTAEGIISYLSTDNISIKDQKIMILGYGNIGYYLAELLKAYQAEFQIYGSSKMEEKYIALAGYSLADFQDFDVVINTIPAQLPWDYTKWQGKRIIEVASSPYGFDIEKLMAHDVKYEIVSAIPAKYSPVSAAKILKNTLEKWL